MFLGIDIGGTKTAVSFTTLQGKYVTTKRFATSKQDFMASLLDGVQAALAAESFPKLYGCGVGVPGKVNHKDGILEYATNLAQTYPLPLAEMIEQAFDVPVRVENDTRLAALGVMEQKGLQNFVYLGIGTGVAAGVVLNGRLWRGINGMAGEIGHVTIDDNNTLLEQHIGGLAISNRIQAAGLNAKDATGLYQLASNGNKQADAIMTDLIRYIGRVIQWLIMTYDVNKVVLGGGVASSDAPFHELLIAELARRRGNNSIDALMLADDKITLLSASDNATIWGAHYLAKQAANMVQEESR